MRPRSGAPSFPILPNRGAADATASGDLERDRPRRGSSSQLALEQAPAHARRLVLGGIQCRICDPLRAGQQRSFGCGGQQSRDLADCALRATQYMRAHRRRPQARRLAKRQHSLKAGEQAAKLRFILPRRQKERLEAVFELVVAANGEIRLPRAQADERDAQLVTEVTQQIQQFALPRYRGSKKVMELVQYQHATADL